jgi:predicted metalloprotease with PDZ domain
MNKLVAALFVCLSSFTFAQHYSFKINLNDCKKDKIAVELICPSSEKDTVYYHFPMTVPGTYDILNYGNYISEFKAFDKNQKALKFQKTSTNTYKIIGAKQLSTITYKVRDSWDSKEKKHKIFEPAGTGFETGEYFYINNGGLFGFFNDRLLLPYHLEFQKPTKMIGYSSMSCLSKDSDKQIFEASDYHQLIDNPILFTTQKEERMKVANADIIVSSYYKQNDSSAYFIKTKLDSSLIAINQFVGGKLPIDNYNFLNYVADFQKIGKILLSGRIRLYQYPKIMRALNGHAFGALEHGNSSSYYLPDFGQNSYRGMVNETAIHEFMHIYAPLSLHSVLIGNFDYVNPKMSKHLWLYEGVTEYFANIISMQGKLTSPETTIKQNFLGKIVSSASYPDSIPFTVMSENVFYKPYKQYYGQVYERGAVMAMLLDFEIMKLTAGEKTLKTVIFELTNTYGKNKSFEETEIIPAFIKCVDPKLQEFFDKYVQGKTPLDIEGGFKTIGVSYQKEKSGLLPIGVLSKENGITANYNIRVNNTVAVLKAKKDNPIGLLVGDKVDLDEVKTCFKKENGEFVNDGDTVNITVIRNDKKVKLSFPAHFKQGVTKNFIEIEANKTAEEEKYFKLWTTGNM